MEMGIRVNVDQKKLQESPPLHTPPQSFSLFRLYIYEPLKEKSLYHNKPQQIKVKNCRLDIYLRDHARVHYKQWKQSRCHVHFTGAMNVLLAELKRN